MAQDPEDVKSYVRQLGYQVQALQEEANRLVLPDDIPELLNSWLQHAEKLSDELPQKPTIQKFLHVALNDYRLNNMQQVRLGILRVMKHFEDANHDKWVMGVQKQYGQNAECLRQINEKTVKPKHDLWQKMADEMRSKSPRRISKLQLARKIKAELDERDPGKSGELNYIRKKII